MKKVLEMNLKCAKNVQELKQLYTCEEIQKLRFEKVEKCSQKSHPPLQKGRLYCEKTKKDNVWKKKSSKRLKFNKVWQQFQIYRSENEKVMASTEVQNVKEAK